MRISTSAKFATLVAASIMAISSSVYAADRGGRDSNSNGENGCAIGNTNPTTCPSQFGR